MGLIEKVRDLGSAALAVSSLVFVKQEKMVPREWAMANAAAKLPLDESDQVYSECGKLVSNFDLVVQQHEATFSERMKPKLIHLFTSAIQFLDPHDGRLPETALAPTDEVSRFIAGVLTSEHPTTVTDQFDIAMRITRGEIVSASGLAMIANRLMARESDRRAYPTLLVTPSDMASWNRHIARFRGADGKVEADGPGDTYYFWTQTFASLVFQMSKDPSKFILQPLFKHGIGLMQLAKKIGGEPTVTKHQEAAKAGWEMGLHLGKKYLTKSN